MKKLIPFFFLFTIFSFAFTMGNTEPKVVEAQPTIGNPDDLQLREADLANCCCSVIVTSTYFNGMTLCGVLVGDPCTVTSSCGDDCGNAQVVPAANKTAQFCWDDSCPICFHNDGIAEIKIKFSCPGGSPANEFPIPPGQWRCYTGDCNGNFVQCDP